jgi:predicted naringenin-chalcone synthase
MGGPQFFVVNWVSPCLSFFFGASTVAAYIFSAPTCNAIIISLEPCALNADFQHFISRFNKISLLYGYP